jgi:hypothetical protein
MNLSQLKICKLCKYVHKTFLGLTFFTYINTVCLLVIVFVSGATFKVILCHITQRPYKHYNHIFMYIVMSGCNLSSYFQPG